MTYEEAMVLLEATATNLLGDSCSVEDERKRKLMLKKYDAIDIAIKALEKQMPKKVEWTEDYTWGVHTPQPVCPACDYYLITTHFIGDGKGKEISYCDHCGQAIDWSE